MADDPSWTPRQDMSLLCRVCANQHDYLIPIFEGEGLDHDMPNKMDKHLPIKVRENDKLPTQMCYQCASTIIAWSELVTNCLEADKKLSRMLKVNENKADTSAIADEDAGSDHYEDAYDDVGGGGDDDNDDDDEDFEKEIKQLISDAGVKIVVPKAAKAKTTRASTRKRKSEAVPVKKENKKSKPDTSVSKSSTALIKPKEEVTSGEDRWACCKCNANYSSCAELTYHAMEHHGAHSEDPSLCTLCLRSMSKHCYHEQLVYMEESVHYVCALCNLNFNTKRTLTKHLKSRHRESYLTKVDNDNSESLVKKFFCPENMENQGLTTDSIKEKETTTGQSSRRARLISFLCFVCKRRFISELEYLYHVRNCCRAGEKAISDEIIDQLVFKTKQSASLLCFFCNNNFKSESLVRFHILSEHHKEGNGDEYSVITEDGIELSDLRCEMCNDLFISMIHLDTHLCGNNKQCRFCEENFSELGCLWSHLLSAHRNKTLSCTLCPALVLDETDLLEHLLKQHLTIVKIFVPHKISKVLKESSRVIVDGKEKFFCKECPSVVNSFSSLTRHMAYAHCDDTLYACDRCSKAFKTKNKLRIHYNSVHERTRSYDCQFCGRGFAISSNLTKHLRIHTGEKPYVCDECGMNFAQSSSLYSHKITHKQDACHVCSHCNKGFLRAYQLRNHHVQVHLGVLPPKSHVCETCGRGFRSNGQLRRHQETHNPERSFVCEQCNAAFTMKKYLVQHYKVHRLA